MRKRNRHVNVWMNEQEYRHLKRQAGIAGLGIGKVEAAEAASLVRQVLMRQANF